MKTLSASSLPILITLLGLGGIASSGSAQTADKSGPLMLSARVLSEATRTNRIVITWNENLTNPTICVQCRTNFQVIHADSITPVTISNMQYNPIGGEGFRPVTILTVSTTNWIIGNDYYVVANRIRDFGNNVVAPNSVVPVTWPDGQVSLPPSDAEPVLTITRTGAAEVRISWPTNSYSFALEWTTNIATLGTNGPWFEEQPFMANPYLANPATGTHRIYRLRKKP